MREISRAARPLRYAPEAGPYRAGTGRLKRAGAGGPPPERWFLRTASSAFPDRRKGRLRKASLLCIKSCLLRGAAQLWPGSFGGTVYKKARQSVRIAGLFACIRHQNCQPEPGFSYVSAPFGGPVQESAEGRLPPSLSVFGAFVKRQPSALLGRVKSFRFQHRAKREEINNFTIARKTILDKRRPFTGRRAGDAKDRAFRASREACR